jgi:hypothetical protein
MTQNLVINTSIASGIGSVPSIKEQLAATYIAGQTISQLITLNAGQQWASTVGFSAISITPSGGPVQLTAARGSNPAYLNQIVNQQTTIDDTVDLFQIVNESTTAVVSVRVVYVVAIGTAPPTPGIVTSVNGRTGAVTLMSSDITGAGGVLASSLALVATSGNYNDLLNKYTLPIATTSVLGGVKAGTGVSIASDGTINVTVSGGSTVAFTSVPLIATANGQSVFTVPGGYTVGLINLYGFGDYLIGGLQYTATDGETITLSSAVAANIVVGVELTLQIFSSFDVANAVAANTLAGAGGAALVGTSEGPTVQQSLDTLNARLTNALTVTVVAATSAGQSVFPIPGGYPVNLITVDLFGTTLINGVDYSATDGANITLTSAVAARVVPGNNLVVNALGSFNVANAAELTTLGASGGAALIGYGAQTVKQALDAGPAISSFASANPISVSDRFIVSQGGNNYAASPDQIAAYAIQQSDTFTQIGTGAVPRSAEDKLQERVSVLDYVLQGDRADLALSQPTKDYTYALAAAIAALPQYGGTVSIPVPMFPCNYVITKSGICIEGTAQTNWQAAATGFAGLIPFDPTKPVLQVGADSGYIVGTRFKNVSITNPSGLGQVGLKLYGGTYGFQAEGFTCNGFITNCVQVINGTTYPATYISFTNFSFVSGAAATSSGAALYCLYGSGAASSFTTAIYLAQGNITGRGASAHQISLDGVQLNLNNVYVQCTGSYTGVYMAKSYSGASSPQLLFSGGSIDAGGSNSNITIESVFSNSYNFPDYIQGNVIFGGTLKASDGTLITSSSSSNYSLYPLQYGPLVLGQLTFPDKANWRDTSGSIYGSGVAGSRILNLQAYRITMTGGVGGGTIDGITFGGITPAAVHATTISASGVASLGVTTTGALTAASVSTPSLSVTAGIATLSNGVPLLLQGNAGVPRYTQVNTGTTPRWAWGSDGSTESGSNSGSSWYLAAYDDTGAALSTPILIARATGKVTLSGGVSTSSIAVTGNVDVSSVGYGMRVAEGVNAKQGIATLVGGTVTVANTSVTANSRILYSVQTAGGTQGFLSTTRVVGTSFTINSTSNTETSTVAYEIFEPG